MKRILLVLYAITLALSAQAADSPSDPGLAEVRSLGRLNGEALACSYREVAARIKLLVIKNTPKSRRYGDTFETATSNAFLGRIKTGAASCLDVAAISSQVDELVARLQTALPPEQSQQGDDAQPEIGIIPRYLLMDTKGQAVSQQDFPGKFQLITFGYTFCPDVCPTTLSKMSLIIDKLGKLADRLQPIFITVDPERDTPEKLGPYIAYFNPRIIGLTGSPELIRHAADHFHVLYSKHQEPGAAPDKYSVDHSTGLYLLGADGRYLGKFPYGAPPAEVAAQIRVLMDQEPR